MLGPLPGTYDVDNLRSTTSRLGGFGRSLMRWPSDGPRWDDRSGKDVADDVTVKQAKNTDVVDVTAKDTNRTTPPAWRRSTGGSEPDRQRRRPQAGGARARQPRERVQRARPDQQDAPRGESSRSTFSASPPSRTSASAARASSRTASYRPRGGQPDRDDRARHAVRRCCSASAWRSSASSPTASCVAPSRSPQRSTLRC